MILILTWVITYACDLTTVDTPLTQEPVYVI